MADKRIIKTRSNIKNAFMDLVCTEELNSITVSELSAKALVNRSTFYLHYGDISAVAADIENEISTRIGSCIDDFDINDPYLSTCVMLRKLTARLDEAPLLKRYIFFSTNSNYIVGRLKSILVEKTEKALHNRIPDRNLVYPLTFAAAGIVDCYIKWVRSEDKETPLEKLIRDVSVITEKIIANLNM